MTDLFEDSSDVAVHVVAQQRLFHLLNKLREVDRVVGFEDCSVFIDLDGFVEATDESIEGARLGRVYFLWGEPSWSCQWYLLMSELQSSGISFILRISSELGSSFSVLSIIFYANSIILLNTLIKKLRSS